MPEPGSKLAHYEITAKLGEGGMGEVWRATDSKLGREVAIKILPEAFAADPERLARFEREAKVLASLNHPSIAAIYGIEQQGETRALVMELVEGPTLEERLKEGRPPFEETLAIGRQIAEALEDAHEKGIVHRDLKPANVKLTTGGKVKVLDFGLAKALDPMVASGSSASQLAHSPTLTIGATMQGVILGTAAYMSPEQARGANADRRADVWAFGVVLYEMLVGASLFAGPTVSDTLASVLKTEPDLAKLPADVPSKTRRLLERCLRKDPRERLHSISDARIVIEEVERGELDEPAAGAVGAATPVRPLWQTLAFLGAALLAGVGIHAALSTILAPAPPEPRVVRFEIQQPAELRSAGAPKLSPDGRHIAFVGVDAKGSKGIWVRSLDATEARLLAGTGEVNPNVRPFWSPDSRALAYFATGKLLRVPIDGGPVQKVCDCGGWDGSWSEQGTIAYDGDRDDPVRVVPASGGVPQELIAAQPGEGGHQVGWPLFLPGGGHLLYVLFGGSEEENGIWMAGSDGSEGRRVLPGLSRVEYAPPGWLLYVRSQTLVAHRFDAGRGELSGEPIPVADGLGVNAVGQADFGVSRDGVLVFRASGGGGDELARFGLDGSRDASPVEPDSPRNPTLSRDGRWLAFDKEGAGKAEGDRDRDIWIKDLRRGVASRFTFGPEREGVPLFSPDGESLFFMRPKEGGVYEIVVKPTGAGEERVLLSNPFPTAPLTISPDGRHLVLTQFQDGQGDLVAVDPARPESVVPLAGTPKANEFGASFSPDGKWLAVSSDESGTNQIYALPFPGPGRKWQLSTDGGVFPAWSPRGDEIAFLGIDRNLYRVSVDTRAGFDAGLPERLFALQPPMTGNILRSMVFTPDGESLIVVTPGGESAPPLSVVVGWDAKLQR